MALFLPTTCTASLLAFGDNITSQELDFVWEGSLGYTVSRKEIKLHLLTGTI